MKNIIINILVIGIIVLACFYVPFQFMVFQWWIYVLVLVIQLYLTYLHYKKRKPGEIYIHLNNDTYSRIATFVFGLISLLCSVFFWPFLSETSLEKFGWIGLCLLAFVLIFSAVFYIPNGKLIFSDKGIAFERNVYESFFSFDSISSVIIENDRITFITNEEKNAIKELDLKEKEKMKILNYFKTFADNISVEFS